MIPVIHIHIADLVTGELAGYSTCLGGDIVLGNPLIIHINEEIYGEKLSVDFRDRFVFIEGVLVALPPRTNKHQVMDYPNRVWIEHPEKMWAEVRYTRDRMLVESDWTEMPAAQIRLGAATLTAWGIYRQALRDVTLQSDPFNIVWPVAH